MKTLKNMHADDLFVDGIFFDVSVIKPLFWCDFSDSSHMAYLTPEDVEDNLDILADRLGITRADYPDEDEFREVLWDEVNNYFCPMMNYLWPVSGEDLDPIALIEEGVGNTALIRDFKMDRYFIALTGGGMDMSEDLIHAYLAFGQLPPVRLCSNITCVSPGMADIILPACEMSLHVASLRLDSSRKRILSLYPDEKAENE